jgi:hypothetical protein
VDFDKDTVKDAPRSKRRVVEKEAAPVERARLDTETITEQVIVKLSSTSA